MVFQTRQLPKSFLILYPDLKINSEDSFFSAQKWQHVWQEYFYDTFHFMSNRWWEKLCPKKGQQISNLLRNDFLQGNSQFGMNFSVFLVLFLCRLSQFTLTFFKNVSVSCQFWIKFSVFLVLFPWGFCQF